MKILKSALAALIAATTLGATSAWAAEDANSPKARCEKEAGAEGLIEASDIKAYVYTCLALADEDAAKATKTASEKKPAQ